MNVEKFGTAFNAEAIRAATVAARDGAEIDAPASADQQIADLIESEFGCHKKQVRSLVVLLGHDLPAPSAGIGTAPTPGTLIFNDNYLRLVVSIDGDGDGLAIKATGGDWYITKASTWRYATDAELSEAFV